MTAEHAVIGCILMDANAGEIFAEMSEKDFTDPDCRKLYAILHGRWREFGQVDIACVPQEFRNLAVECVDFLPSVSGWKSYVATAKDDAMRNRVQTLGLTLATNGLEREEIQEAANSIMLAIQGNEPVRRMNMAQALEAFWAGQQKAPNYLKTGIEKLDKTAFIESGDYVVIGARPSAGKTAMALKLARHLARQDIKTAFYSYETTIEKMMGRTISAHCGVEMTSIKNHTIGNREELEHLSEDLTGLPFEFVQSAGKGIGWIKADVMRTGAKAIFIDYIGIVAKTESGSSRFEQVTNASLAIRDLCQSTGVTAFVLCQINRQGKAAPTMEDLKESGQIEQDADVVLILHNEHDIQERQRISPVKLIVAKNKEGEVGAINMLFDGQLQEFWEIAGGYS